MKISARIEDQLMTAEHGGRVIATARYSSHAAAGRQARGSCLISPPFVHRNQAITAMVLAERLAAGLGDDDLFVIGWREELGLRRTG
jgi:hypothetical protein